MSESRTAKIQRAASLESMLNKRDLISTNRIREQITDPELGLQGRVAAMAEAIATSVDASEAFVYVPDPNTVHGRFLMETKDVYSIVDQESTQKLLREGLDITSLLANVNRGNNSTMLVPFDLGKGKNGIIYVGKKRKGNYRKRDLAFISSLHKIMANSINEKSAVGSFGLHDRGHLFERMEEDILTALGRSLGYAFMMIDADTFKQYNDVWDYTVGDKILQTIADVIIEKSRGIDVYARYGGDEMCIFMPQTDAGTATNLAESIREAVEQVDTGLYFTVGIYSNSKGRVSAEEFKYLDLDEKKALEFKPLTIEQYRAEKPSLKPYTQKRAATKEDFEEDQRKQPSKRYVGKQKLTVSIGIANKPAELSADKYMAPHYRKRNKTGKMLLSDFLDGNKEYAPFFDGASITPDNVGRFSEIIAGDSRLTAAYARFCIIYEAGEKSHLAKHQGRNRVAW